jgi:hypothetical protein
LHAVYGYIPCFKNEAAYRQYLEATKVNSEKSIALIKASFTKSLWALVDGEEVEIVSAEPEYVADPKRPQAKLVPIAKAVSVLQVQPILVKNRDKEAPWWIPSAYVRPDGSRPYPIESKFFVLAPYMDQNAPAIPGREMRLCNEDEEFIYSAKSREDFPDMAKAILAKDAIGLTELAKMKKIVKVPDDTKVLIIDNHANAYADRRVKAAEIRFTEGPYKGEIGWVFETHTALPALNIVTFQEAARIVNPPKKKKR